jgi:serine/threonine protein kinase/tetratricopeptide (TPR) repeat protein
MAMNEETLFHLALGKPAGERTAFLADACGDDEKLRRRLEALLSAHDHPGSFLEAPAVNSLASDTQTGPLTDGRGPAAPGDGASPPRPAGEGPGSQVGPYTLLRPIGEGGMGTVFLAEQARPVRRQVALKVIKPGLDSRQVIARFEQERQALALMDHPNIAKVLDAGTTESGRPFFVMELVPGTPLTDYCDEARLSVRERLRLFVPVCRAVQHAHQKGVIHRDLKPSNVLVAPYDGRPVPKVIDFGVAKAAGASLAERTLHTEFGSVVGTLEYMSPEQADLSRLDIDTRSDVYALGVLLYELLTGTTPLDRGRLRQGGLLGLLRAIREEEPPPPSARLGAAPGLPSAAWRRGQELRRLSGLVRGELDWIVMKCLEKDRDRRYESAEALARDVERHLRDEPVQAGPPSATYRLRKYVRRHLGAVVAAAFVVMTLVGGALGMTFGLLRAVSERDEKDRARREAVASAAAEKAARLTAQKRLEQVNNAGLILSTIIEHLDPDTREIPDGPLRSQLAQDLGRAAEYLTDDATDDAADVARLRVRLAEALQALGHPAEARALFARSIETFARELGPDDRETLLAAHHLALAYKDESNPAEARSLLEQTARRQAEVLGPDHKDTISAQSSLAAVYRDLGRLDLAVPLQEQCQARARAALGKDHSLTLSALHQLAATYSDAGRPDEALRLFEEVLEKTRARYGPEHERTLASLNNLASAYKAVGRSGEALKMHEEASEKLTALLGPRHPRAVAALANLAGDYLDIGLAKQALPLYQRAFDVLKSRLGDNDPQTLLVMRNLGAAYRETRQTANAIDVLEEAVRRYRAVRGPEDPDTLDAVRELACTYVNAGRVAEALALLEPAVEKSRALRGTDHPKTLNVQSALAWALWSAKRLDRSVPQYEDLLRRQQAALGPCHPSTWLSVVNLAVNYRDAGRLPDAVRLLEENLRRVRESGRPLPNASQATLNRFGRMWESAGLLELTEPVLRHEAEQAKAQFGADDLRTANFLASLGSNLLAQRKYAQAEPPLRECLTAREARQPDGWPTFNAKSLLGGALLGRRQYAEAEPLLRQGYDGLKRHEAEVPATAKARVAEALERVIQFYEATDKPDEAAKWRARRPDPPKPKPSADGPKPGR